MERLSIRPSLLQMMHFDNQKWSRNRGFAAAGQPLGRMERCCCLLPACGLLGRSPSHWRSCPAVAISSGCGRRMLKLPRDENGSWSVSHRAHWFSVGLAGLGRWEQTAMAQRQCYSERPGARGAASFLHGDTAVLRG